MNCNRSQELLALYAGGDLTGAETATVNQHVAQCTECQEFYRRLEQNQSLLRSFRRETVTAVTSASLAEMRQGLMSQIGSGREALGWAVRIERFVSPGFRKPLYALAGLAVIAILSVTLFAQMRNLGTEAAGPQPLFEAGTTLVRPEGYREWIFIGSSVGPGHPEDSNLRALGSDLFRNVYINPRSYREYLKTGKFPEGTVLVLESARAEPRERGDRYEKEFVALKASVKDSRFEGGWGYYDFTEREGELVARAVPETDGCLSCHRDRAETDHVFTQFYPVLRSVL